MKNYAFDEFLFDATKKELRRDSKLIPLQPKVAEMLAVFLEQHGELISREELMNALWKDTFVEETNLRFCIHSLRKVLGKKSGGKDYIETVPRRGYRFIGEIKDTGAENSIGRYKILEKIGVGGMGEVFLANDPQLDRKVAVKVLLPQVAQDDERIRRFKSEAKAVSALNHPNIVTIYEIGEFNEKLFIAYEFIEGQTLREKIKRNQLTVEESIIIAEQIANALFVAHQANIIHRDIKPENIMIRKDGYAKILDFGLAKRTAFAPADEEETFEWVKTQKGIILGSVQYMSPEQSRGIETDERSDIWSLGVVLYEMLTGKNPFEGETVSDSIAAILNFEPKSISRFLQSFPAELREVIEKALQKDLVFRYQNIKDFAEGLKNARLALGKNILTKRLFWDVSQEDTVQIETRITDEQATIRQESKDLKIEFGEENAAQSSQKKRWRKRLVLLPIAAVFASVCLFYTYNYIHPFLFPNYYDRFQNPRITRLTNDGKSSNAAISDDKKWVSFVREAEGKKNLIVKKIGEANENKIISITEEEILQPTFAPQSKTLFSFRETDDLYFVVKGKNGGTLYNSYLSKGEFSTGLKKLPNVDSRISFSPDGKRFAFIRQNENAKSSSLFISSSDLFDEQATISNERLNSKNTKLTKFESVAWQNNGEEFTISGLTEFDDRSAKGSIYETNDRGFRTRGGSAQNIEWMENGSLFSLRGFSLDFDPPLGYKGLKDIESDYYRFTSFDVTADGKTLVAAAKPINQSIWFWDSKTNQNKQILDEYYGIDVVNGSSIIEMPDGRILFAKKNIEKPQEIKIVGKDSPRLVSYPKFQIYTANPDGTDQIRLTQCKSDCVRPVLTPDGRFILYQARGWNQDEEKGIWRINADGSNSVQLTDNKGDSGIKITSDGQTIYFQRYDSAERNSRIMKVSINGGETSVVNFENNPEGEMGEYQFFDNGKSLAYLSSQLNKETSKYKTKLKIASLNENGTIQPISERDFDGRNFRISPDNKWIFFLKDKGIFRLPVNSNSSETKPEQVVKPESGRIEDFGWSNKNETLFYLLDSEKSDVFLIEDAR